MGIDEEVNRAFNALSEEQKKEIERRIEGYYQRVVRMMNEDLPRVPDKRILTALGYGYLKGYQRAMRDNQKRFKH